MIEDHDHIAALKGLTWRRSAWTRPRSDWDHDHCAACWVKFSDVDSLDALREGYTTGEDYTLGAGYEWVCNECFLKLKQKMGWSVASASDEPAA